MQLWPVCVASDPRKRQLANICINPLCLLYEASNELNGYDFKIYPETIAWCSDGPSSVPRIGGWTGKVWMA